MKNYTHYPWFPTYLARLNSLTRSLSRFPSEKTKCDTHPESGGFNLGAALGISEDVLHSDGLNQNSPRLMLHFSSPSFVEVVEVDGDGGMLLLLVEIAARTWV